MSVSSSLPNPLFIKSSSEWPNAVLPYGEEGQGTPVIMLHGLESHSGWFFQSASHIASLGHPVYALDRRGSGHSAAPRGRCMDFADLLDDMDSVADEVMSRHDTSKFHLLGHCFGAIPATVYACRFREKLASLLLATPAIYTKKEPPFFGKLKIFWAALTGSKLEIPVSLKPEWFTDQKEYLDFIRGDSLSLKYVSARVYWEIVKARRLIHAYESQMTMPVFMAMAGKDQICDNGQNVEFFDRLPARTKESVMFKDAVHILEFSDEKDAFFSALTTWLNKMEG